MDDDFEMYDEDESSQNSSNLYNSQEPEPTYQNDSSTSVLTPMYEEDNNASYEEELKTATPKEEKKEEEPVEEAPKEVTYTDDFMDYDPMLHNGLQTDGDYVITSFDPDQNSDYVPEKTDFDSENMMESYSEENVEVEPPKKEEEEPPVPEDYNTAGMMTYDTNNVDTFNDGKAPTETVVTRFIFDEMKNSDETQNNQIDQQEEPRNVGVIPIYNRQDEIDKNIKNQNSNRKTYEMIGMVIFFALLILVISFFPNINKIFDNLKK